MLALEAATERLTWRNALRENFWNTQIIPPIIGSKIVMIIAKGTLMAYINPNIPIIIKPLLAKFRITSVYNVRNDSTSLVMRVTQFPIGNL